MKYFPSFKILIRCAACTVALLAASALTAKEPLNVVLILADDLGSVDLNCYGADDLSTPNIDALAERGVRFSQFYVGSAICSPSRAALLTGRYPQRAQLPRNTDYTGMPGSQLTLAELFQGAGYRTALIGKWHLGETPQTDPQAQGFDEFFGHRRGCIDNYSHFFYWSGPNRHDLWRNRTEVFEPGEYFPDLMVRETKRFFQEHTEQPFFLYLALNTPHYPMQAEQKFVEMYADLADPNRQRYAAFVTSLDDKVGQVLAELDRLGLAENTLVVFMSDHGHSTEDRAFGGGGSAGPYRGAKATLWEGGIRVPCIVSLPAVIPAGEVRDQLVTSMDLFPTIAEYAGLTLPDRKIDGLSITNLIADADIDSPHRTWYWELYGRWAVRHGQWKLVKTDNETFLSDLSKDLSERQNLAAAYPDVVKQLSDMHKAWKVESLLQ